MNNKMLPSQNIVVMATTSRGLCYPAKTLPFGPCPLHPLNQALVPDRPNLKAGSYLAWTVWSVPLLHRTQWQICNVFIHMRTCTISHTYTFLKDTSTCGGIIIGTAHQPSSLCACRVGSGTQLGLLFVCRTSGSVLTHIHPPHPLPKPVTIMVSAIG